MEIEILEGIRSQLDSIVWMLIFHSITLLCLVLINIMGWRK